jgi:hypothetical protein
MFTQRLEGAGTPLHLSGERETGQRNEIANGHENHGVGVHYNAAPGGNMAPLRELPTAGGLCGLWGRPRGGLGFILHQTRTGDSP